MAISRPASASVLAEETLSTLVTRVMKSVSKAFDSISPGLAAVALWNIMVTQRLGYADVVGMPAQFIEGLRAIYDEAQAKAIEAKIVKEVQAEFGLAEKAMSFPDAVRSVLTR